MHYSLTKENGKHRMVLTLEAFDNCIACGGANSRQRATREAFAVRTCQDHSLSRCSLPGLNL